MVSYAKLILMAVAGECRSVTCLIILWKINHPHLDIRNVYKISKYLVYLINSKTKCDCLTWMVFYEELYYLGNDSQLT